jgi:uncharacterized membrane protein
VTKISTYWKQIQQQTKRSIKSNWGFPFIAAFLILLSTAAVFFAANLKWVAEIIAEGAYFALLIGVLFQLGNVLLEKNKKEGAGVNGSG